jgi:lipopolysaccharide assembly protein B
LDSILPSYRDPLFSVLLIVAILLMITILTYIWGVYRQHKDKSALHKFLEKFESNECALDTAHMSYSDEMFTPLALLAKVFQSNGEYHKAIRLYLHLIKHVGNPVDRYDLLERLGQTYLRAGFLERAKNIFLEVLHKQPRNPQVLQELGIVHEMMRDYQRASEVILPLKTMENETRQLEKFLEFGQIISDKQAAAEAKSEQLVALLKEEPVLYRPIISKLFWLDTAKAWAHLDHEAIHKVLDILWFLPYAQLDLDRVTQDPALSTLYYAKGYLTEPIRKSGLFPIDMLASARMSGFEEATLVFEYLCSQCKQSFPVPFTRCPGCLALHTIEVKESIAKQSPQSDHSLL